MSFSVAIPVNLSTCEHQNSLTILIIVIISILLSVFSFFEWRGTSATIAQWFCLYLNRTQGNQWNVSKCSHEFMINDDSSQIHFLNISSTKQSVSGFSVGLLRLENVPLQSKYMNLTIARPTSPKSSKNWIKQDLKAQLLSHFVHRSIDFTR